MNEEELIPTHPIPTEWATYLCKEVCHDAKNQWFSLAKMMCWHCHTVSHGDFAKFGFVRKPGNHGCPWVDARDRHYYWAFHKSEP